MTRRFDVKRMDGGEFSAALKRLKISERTFARIFGIGEPKQIEGWIRGTVPIPYWVRPLLRVMEKCPGAIVEAKQAAAEQITADRSRPELGDYPFLEKH